MNQYECFYRGKRYTVEADTSYKAQQELAARLRIPTKKKYNITVMLVALKGEQYTHSTGGL